MEDVKRDFIIFEGEICGDLGVDGMMICIGIL